jgi:hypothetical protein
MQPQASVVAGVLGVASPAISCSIEVLLMGSTATDLMHRSPDHATGCLSLVPHELMNVERHGQPEVRRIAVTSLADHDRRLRTGPRKL